VRSTYAINPIILLQTAAAIYLMIRGFENLEKWWADKRTGSVRE
jgi:hypothetical protein